MEAVLARQRQAKAALFAKVLSEYRLWSNGEATSYVDGSNVPSLRVKQLSAALVHDWAFAKLEGELGNGEEGAGAVRDWARWVRLLSDKFKLPARHLYTYEALMRRGAEPQGRGSRRRRVAEGEVASAAGGEGGGQRRVDGGTRIVGLADDILLLLREFSGHRDFNALARTSKGVLQRTASAVPLWQSLCFSTGCSASNLEAAIRRSARELHTLALPEKLETDDATILAKLAEEGYFDKLQRLCVPSYYWAAAFEALLAAHPPPRLHTLVCIVSVLWKIGDVRGKVYGRLASLRRVHLRGGLHDRCPGTMELLAIPPHSTIESISTPCRFFHPHDLSYGVKYLQLFNYWFDGDFRTLPCVERVDVVYGCGGHPFRCALPSARVLTLQGIFALNSTMHEWMSGGLWCRYPSLEYLMVTGRNHEYREGQHPWSAHDFAKIITTLANDTMPRLKYAVFRCSDPDCLKYPDGSTQHHRDGWTFYSAPVGELERSGILRPLPQVVAQDSYRDPTWRARGHIKHGDDVDRKALQVFTFMEREEGVAMIRGMWALVGVRNGHS